jgi:hypothetical protein
MIATPTPNMKTRTNHKAGPAHRKKKWSARVTKHSDAMDLKKGVFTQPDPKKIARSIKNSAARSTRRKSTAQRSAMSMLNFYVNRAGKNLSPAQKGKLARAKDELRKLPD